MEEEGGGKEVSGEEEVFEEGGTEDNGGRTEGGVDEVRGTMEVVEGRREERRRLESQFDLELEREDSKADIFSWRSL